MTTSSSTAPPARSATPRARPIPLGVNWYANEAVKVSANYVKAKTDKISNANGDDSGDGLVMRLQYVF